MLKFKKLKHNSLQLKKFYEQSKIEFCDISVGVKFLWRDEFKISYAIYNDTLILKETNKELKDAFYYPMGKDEAGALEEIINLTLKKGRDLTICYLDEERVELLKNRFSSAESYFDRDWSDYLYDAKSFKELIGRKYSGQRNHINKFKKLYPDYEYKRIEKADIKGIKKFLTKYNKAKSHGGLMEKAENRHLLEYLKNLDALNSIGAIIKVGGEVVALTAGERIKNTFIVHVEKALVKYSGVYPTIANLFINDVIDSDIDTINREEDCGDEGLRVSKTQYHPKEIKNKYILKIKAQ